MSLIIMEIYSKTTVRYHFKSPNWKKSRTLTMPSMHKCMGQRECQSSCWWKCKLANHARNHCGDAYPSWTHTYFMTWHLHYEEYIIEKTLCKWARTFMLAALFILAKFWNNLGMAYGSRMERESRLWSHTHLYTAVKMNSSQVLTRTKFKNLSMEKISNRISHDPICIKFKIRQN